MRGAVKFSREIQDWEWFDDPNTMYCLFRLVMMASWMDKERRGTRIEKGQFITSLSELSSELNLSVRQTRTCLKRIENDKLIDMQTTNKWTKITICNYDDYQLTAQAKRQINDTQSDKQNDKQTTNKTTSHIKEDNTLSPTNVGSKDIIQEERKKDANASQESGGVTPRRVIELWNQICTRCSKVRGLSESRADKVRSRLGQMSGDKEATIRELFAKVNASDFLCFGSNSSEHKNWRVNFDWVFQNDTNWLKIIEGEYDNNKKGLLPGEAEWRIKDKAYSKADFDKHPDEYSQLDNPLKNRLIMGHKIVWTGTYWRRDDFVL